jgi:hypothetical protein
MQRDSTPTRDVWSNYNGTNPMQLFFSIVDSGTTNILGVTVQVYVDGALFATYNPAWDSSGSFWKITFPTGGLPPNGATLEIARQTPILPLVTGHEALQNAYALQEVADALAYANGHAQGPFLLNSDTSDTSPAFMGGFPVVQALPQGRLDTYPDVINPNGFNKAHYRFQSRLPFSTPPESMSFAAFQSVIENPALASVPFGPGGNNDSVLYLWPATGSRILNVRFRTLSYTSGGSVTFTPATMTVPNILSVHPKTGLGDVKSIADQINADPTANLYFRADWSGSLVNQAPSGGLTAPDCYGPTIRKTYQGMNITMRGYEGGFTSIEDDKALWNAPQGTAALSVIAEIGGGQANGKAEGLVVSAQSERTPDTLTLGTGSAGIIFSVRWNKLYDNSVTTVSIVTGSGSSPVVTLTTSGTNPITYAVQIALALQGSTAGDVIAAVNDETNPDQVWRYVIASQLDPDDDSGMVSTGSGTLIDGMTTNGKQVAIQARVLPFNDPGQGPPPNLNNFDNFGIALNSDGTYPGYAAVIVQSQDDGNDPTVNSQGWYNAYVADDSSLTSRLLWYYTFAVITANNSTLPDSIFRPGVWMGLGTDLPLSPLHVVVPANADLRLENTATNSAPTTIANVNFYGVGNASASAKKMAGISAYLGAPASGMENCQLDVYAMLTGTLSKTWSIADGIWAPIGTNTNKGAGSINASRLFQTGFPALIGGTAQISVTTPLTLVVGTDAPEQYHVATLSSAQNITLSTTGVYDGARFRIIRRSGGGSNLNVKDGSNVLKALAASTWGDFTYSTMVSPAGWYLSAYGML